MKVRSAAGPRSTVGLRSTGGVRWILLAVLLTSACARGNAVTAPNDPIAIAAAADTRPAVTRIGYSVSDLESIVDFYRTALDFDWVEGGGLERRFSKEDPDETRSARFARLRLGDEIVELVEYTPSGRAIPVSASNDLWFQHLAIVVSDIDAATRRALAHGATAVSVGGPQTIPASNATAGGIRAFYFRDPEDHVLELIWYPPGKGQPRWQARDRLFLGIDHTAIGVSDTVRSRAFYEDLLGFRKTGESSNHGPEQAALSGVHGARVEITGLSGRRGPGIELLRYHEPGAGRPMPADTRLEDLWHWEIALQVPQQSRLLERAREQNAVWSDPGADAAVWLRDPDGHGIRVLAAPP